MKKYVLCLLTLLMIFSSVGCSKQEETVAEVMEKVKQRYENAYGLDMKMDADYTVSISGIEIKMNMEISMKQENIQDVGKLVMESDMEMNMLGQTVSIKEWVKDGVMYIDDNEMKTKQELDSSDLAEMSGKMGMFSQESFTEFTKNATLEKVGDGYVISGSVDYENAFEDILGNLGLGESMGVDLVEVLSTLDVENFDIRYEVSDEYEIETGHVDLKAEMMVNGQKMSLNLDMELEMEAYDESRIQLPDLSAWDVESVSCSYESGGISELMVMNALDDDITDIQSYMVIDYATYGIGSAEEKENLIRQTQEMYQNYVGVECSVDDLGDSMGVAISVDMNMADVSTLIELGLANEESVENQGFSLLQSIAGLEAGGYSCN